MTYSNVNNVSTYLFFHRDFHAVISRAHAQWRSKWRISLILNRTTTKLVTGITMQTVGCLIRKLVKGLIKTYISIIKPKFIRDIFYLDTPSVTLFVKCAEFSLLIFLKNIFKKIQSCITMYINTDKCIRVYI